MVIRYARRRAQSEALGIKPEGFIHLGMPMKKRIAVLVDAGHLRVALKRSTQPYTADCIEKICLQCAKPEEEVVRILYYDCEPFVGELKFPISKKKLPYGKTTSILHDLALKDLFAVRRGILKFRGFTIRKDHQPSNPPQDSDFEPTFEQKGVDCGLAWIWRCFLLTAPLNCSH